MSLTTSRGNDGAMTEEERAWTMKVWGRYCRGVRIRDEHRRMCGRVEPNRVERMRARAEEMRAVTRAWDAENAARTGARR